MRYDKPILIDDFEGRPTHGSVAYFAVRMHELERQLEAQVNRVCQWRRELATVQGTLIGECGFRWPYPVQSDMHYCPKCGGKIEVKA